MGSRAHSGGGADPGLSVQFGPFELDLRGGELRKEGHRIRLQEQPFQILRMLLESPGEVVSREDIQGRLWPDNTVVEFDHSINAAVKRLRDALRDSADKPRYIETVARRGYRFIADIEPLTHHATVAEPTAVTLAATELTNGQHAEATPRGAWVYRRPWIPVSLVVAMVIMVWASVEVNRRSDRPAAAPLQPLMRLDLELGAEMPPGSEPGASAILSPDGRRLVSSSRSRLFISELDQAKASELPGTEKARAPFFSPDGQWVAFFVGENLKKLSLAGGAPIDVGKCPLGNGGSWGEEGSIIAGCNFALSRFPSVGGPPTPVTTPARGEIVHRWPQILAGGKVVLFTSYPSVTGLEGAAIEVVSLADRRQTILVHGGTWGRYLRSGHLVYIDKGTLFALPFDSDRLELRGAPTPVLEEIAYSTAWGSAQIDVSQSGTLVYRASRTGEGLVTVQWLDGTGNTRPLLPVPGSYLSPTLSPDGSRLAMTSAGDIWVYELGRGSMTRLTFGGGYGNPLWSADGRYIVFRAARGMLCTHSDGSTQPQVLTQSSNQQTPWSFTPDGKQLAFVEIDQATGADIWTVPVEIGPSDLRAGQPEAFLQTSFHERGPAFSPDGRWLAYMSNESGPYQVYVEAFPHKSRKRQVSTDRGGYPAWSRNGNELFFWGLGHDSQLMVATYRAHGDSFLSDKPRVYSTKIVGFGTTRSYDPAPDGKHIIALTAADTGQASNDRVVFLLNFFDELRRRIHLSTN